MIVLILLLSAAQASASVRDEQLGLLLATKNRVQFTNAVSDGGAIQSLHETCARELDLNEIPSSCFKEAKLKRTLNLVSQDRAEQKSMALSSFCQRAAREMSDPHKLSVAMQADSLPENCRVAVKKRFDDLSYQIGEVRELDQFLK